MITKKPSQKATLTEQLRQKIAALESGAAAGIQPLSAQRLSAQGKLGLRKLNHMSLGVPVIDKHLPGAGLAMAALHEIRGQEDGAATAFCAWLAARRAAHGASGIKNEVERNVKTDLKPSLKPSLKPGPKPGTVLWCVQGRDGALYGPGLAALGLLPEHLVLACARNDEEALWVLEEGLRSRGPCIVVAEVAKLGLTASRRVQLAAEEGGATALVLRPLTASNNPIAAHTRWRISAAPSRQSDSTEGQAYPETGTAAAGDLQRIAGAWRLQAELLRCKGGMPGSWLLEWQGLPGFVLADRQSAPEVATAAAPTESTISVAGFSR